MSAPRCREYGTPSFRPSCSRPVLLGGNVRKLCDLSWEFIQIRMRCFYIFPYKDMAIISFNSLIFFMFEYDDVILPEPLEWHMESWDKGASLYTPMSIDLYSIEPL